jgi:nitrate reductase assembly molybdenum cofactor insertion protein NarJ
MSFFNTTPTTATKTLRVLAHLLSYPDAELRAHLPELQTPCTTSARSAVRAWPNWTP